MSKNSLLNSYISRAEEIIEKVDIEAADEFLGETLAVFREEIPNIMDYLDYPYLSKVNIDYLKDVKRVKAQLENYRANLKSGLKPFNKGGATVSVNNLNNNSNNNSNEITVNMDIKDVKQQIEDNTYIGDSEKEELLNVLQEIKELQTSQENKSKKWDRAKRILAFILDKGADIAIMYIPQILKALQ